MDNDTPTSGITPVSVPALPIEGGCQCGALRYRITAPPLTYYACHCTICQRQSGSAFGSSLLVPATAIEIDGPSRTYSA